MNESIQQQLQKYMMETGYYDTTQIRMDEGKDRKHAMFADLFSDSHNEGKPEQKSELLIAAEDANRAKREADSAQQLDEALNAPVESLTDKQWNVLIANGYAKVVEIPGDDHVQGGFSYVRTDKRPDVPAGFADEPEEELARRGL